MKRVMRKFKSLNATYQDTGILHLWCYFIEDVDEVIFDGKKYNLTVSPFVDKHPNDLPKLSKDIEQKVLEFLDENVGSVVGVDRDYIAVERDLVSSAVVINFNYPFNGVLGALVGSLKKIEERINEIVPPQIRCNLGVKFPDESTLRRIGKKYLTER